MWASRGYPAPGPAPRRTLPLHGPRSEYILRAARGWLRLERPFPRELPSLAAHRPEKTDRAVPRTGSDAARIPPFLQPVTRMGARSRVADGRRTTRDQNRGTWPGCPATNPWQSVRSTDTENLRTRLRRTQRPCAQRVRHPAGSPARLVTLRPPGPGLGRACHWTLTDGVRAPS